MKRIFILIAVFSVVAAGCSREKGTAPAPGVESGELPPAEGLEEGGRTTPSADPAGTVPGAAQEQPTAPPAEEPKRQEGSSSAKQPSRRTAPASTRRSCRRARRSSLKSDALTATPSQAKAVSSGRIWRTLGTSTRMCSSIWISSTTRPSSGSRACRPSRILPRRTCAR